MHYKLSDKSQICIMRQIGGILKEIPSLNDISRRRDCMNSWPVLTKILMNSKGEYWDEDLCLPLVKHSQKLDLRLVRRQVMLGGKKDSATTSSGQDLSNYSLGYKSYKIWENRRTTNAMDDLGSIIATRMDIHVKNVGTYT